MAMDGIGSDDGLLSQPSDREPAIPERTASSFIPIPTFTLPRGDQRHYQQQYADMYFARLAQLKPAVDRIAADAWAGFEIAGETAHRVDRVLDVRQGELCWVIGTCFMEMPLKPNVLDDIGKEHWIAAPPPRAKYLDDEGGGSQVMLEDESGRLRLTGDLLGSLLLVTGAIVAVIGTENAQGDFEVLDLKVPDLARQPQRWERADAIAVVKGKSVTQSKPQSGKLAIVSGLEISGDGGDVLSLDLLAEWLLGEAAGDQDQRETARISRLIIAGNSLFHSSPIATREEVAAAALKNKGQRKYGYDSSAYNAAPSDSLDSWMATLLPSLPITLIPGESDPTSQQLPQQPIHAAMFPHCRAYMEPPGSKETGWLEAMTNPFEAEIDGWRISGSGGQPVDDIYRYISVESRAEIMEAMLRWRLAAPTAPDTLWCYPFQDGDAFVMKECPHVFIVGNQPAFETTVIEGPLGQAVRLIAVPKFRETGELVVLDMETLTPEIVHFDTFGGG